MQADVVIIGGGVVGMSIAYHLAVRGCTNVRVVEREVCAAGSTGRGTGAIRRLFPREIEARMAVEAVAFWARFEDTTGVDLAFQRRGYLYAVSEPNALRRLTRDAAMQARLGIPVNVVAPDDIARLVPGMVMDDVIGGVYCASDGRAVGRNALAGFRRIAEDRGVKVMEHTAVQAIEVTAGKVSGVVTSAGTIATPMVVNAAGPWAAEIGRMVGATVPVTPKRMMQFVTGPIDGLPQNLPLVASVPSTLFMAPDGGGLLLGMRQADPPQDTLEVDMGFYDGLLAKAVARMPVLAGAKLDRAWAGYTEASPDSLGIIGPVPQVDGFLCANGFSGHGFMLSPATGRIVAGLILDGHVADLDLTQLSVDRFAHKS